MSNSIKKPKNQGVSLIELLTVIGLVALTAGFVLPSFGKFIARQQVQALSIDIKNSFTGAKTWSVTHHTPIIICSSSDSLTCDRNWSGQLMTIADINYNEKYEPGVDHVLQRLPLSPHKLSVHAKRNLYYYRLRSNGALKIAGESIIICHPTYDDIGLRVVLWRVGSYRITDKDSNNKPITCTA